MLRQLLAVFLLAGVLTACAAPAAQTPTEAPTSAPAPTEAPTAAPAPTAAMAAPESTNVATAAPGSAAAVVFRIIPEDSQVTYEVGETFLNQNNRYAVAVGRTQQVNGEVRFDPANPRNSSVGTITIDISAFTSDSPRRDNAIRDRWLESARYPLATFTPTAIEGLPETYTSGEEVTLTITGDLTVREVTRPTTFTVTGALDGETIRGMAETQIKMTDFGFQPPDIAGVLRAEDDVKISFSFVARPVE
ncbi:MAG: YceI family protein [Oscillochloridaceae bacterium]|nr:YceI family protein [Chloroflexaceae bacterium]MDW8391813.1 YceI family protein [Oscillochloridaceae bacterium]